MIEVSESRHHPAPAQTGAGEPPETAPRSVTPRPRVHELATELLTAAGTTTPDRGDEMIIGMVEAADAAAPPRVEAAGGGCGGGRRILLDGEGVVLTDGPRPTHLLIRALGPDSTGVLVLVERGDRGIDPWPREGEITGPVHLRSVRLDAGRVVSGTVGDGDPGDRR